MQTYFSMDEVTHFWELKFTLWNIYFLSAPRKWNFVLVEKVTMDKIKTRLWATLTPEGEVDYIWLHIKCFLLVIVISWIEWEIH